MAYPASPGPAAPAARPSTVTAAMYLLYLGAALSLLSAILTFANLSGFRAAFEEAYRGTQAEGADGAAVGFAVGGAVFGLLIGALLIMLAVFNGRGKNWARITTWVLGGIYLCCVGAGLASQGLANSMGGGGNQGPSAEQMEQAMENNLPGWFLASQTPLSVLGILAILATIILLALPASNAFFRKAPEQPVWQPPTQ